MDRYSIFSFAGFFPVPSGGVDGCSRIEGESCVSVGPSAITDEIKGLYKGKNEWKGIVAPCAVRWRVAGAAR